jgi:hypothetical protein
LLGAKVAARKRTKVHEKKTKLAQIPGKLAFLLPFPYSTPKSLKSFKKMQFDHKTRLEEFSRTLGSQNRPIFPRRRKSAQNP